MKTMGHTGSSGSVLPLHGFFVHGVCDAADRVFGDLRSVDLLQMRRDLACRETFGIERHDRFVEAAHSALVLGNDLRLEGSDPVFRHLQGHRTDVCVDGLCVVPFLALPDPRPDGSWAS
jgi:hypothetical protein